MRKLDKELALERRISIDEFVRAIRRLPSDEPRINPRIWYKTQKEHWLGWLDEYDGPGAYGRLPHKNRDAKFVYNHIVEPGMLLWLIEAAGVSQDLVAAARTAAEDGKTLMQKSGIIRRHVPWTKVIVAIWAGDNIP